MKRTPLKRKSWLNRHAPLRPVNRKRRFRLRGTQYTAGMAYDDWIRSKPCACCGRGDHIEAAHVRSRGAGGTAEDQIPLCCFCHYDQHNGGWLPESHDKRSGHKGIQITQGDAEALAESLWELFLEERAG